MGYREYAKAVQDGQWARGVRCAIDKNHRAAYGYFKRDLSPPKDKNRWLCDPCYSKIRYRLKKERVAQIKVLPDHEPLPNKLESCFREVIAKQIEETIMCANGSDHVIGKNRFNDPNNASRELCTKCHTEARILWQQNNNMHCANGKDHPFYGYPLRSHPSNRTISLCILCFREAFADKIASDLQNRAEKPSAS